MRAMKRALLVAGLTALVAGGSAQAGGINGINGSMPSRLSMNLTVAKQTQGVNFGEKVASGLQSGASALAQGASMQVVVECGQAACVVAFPGGDGYRVDLQAMALESLDAAKAAGSSARTVGQGASLLGGAMPAGSGIVSVAVSALGGKPGGAVSSSYAAGRAAGTGELPMRSGEAGQVDLQEPLVDGDYTLAVVVQKATSGLKDTLKTQVRMAAPQQVRIEVGFSVQAGAIRVAHDMAKNSVRNLR